MNIKCCLSVAYSNIEMILPRHAIFFICLCVYVLIYLCLIYVIYFFIIIFIFITINCIISLRHKNLFFGHACQKFSLKVLLSFFLVFCQYQPGVAYKSVAYIKKNAYRTILYGWNMTAWIKGLSGICFFNFSH